jgi:hypothetical protein
MLAAARCILMLTSRNELINLDPSQFRSMNPCRSYKGGCINTVFPTPTFNNELTAHYPLKTLESILRGEAKSNSPFAIEYLDKPSLLKSSKDDQSAPTVSNSDKVGMSWNLDCPASLSQA